MKVKTKELIELEQRFYECNGAMARLCRAVSRRMMPDEPTPEDRMELLEAYNNACEILRALTPEKP